MFPWKNGLGMMCLMASVGGAGLVKAGNPDIVGPLQRTKHGNKYILTMMDFCTRHPEAVPLRRIDASTIADALCEIFTRLGLPEAILCPR